MPQHWPAANIARMILDGFDDYREHFRQITDGARARFEQAKWQEAQIASAARINLYEEKVGETVARLRSSFEVDTLMDDSSWPLVKSAYITLIDLRFDDELSETWYNSIFCGLFSHDLISDGCMFIHTTRPSLRRARAAQTRTYKPQGKLAGMLASVFADYRFSEEYADLPADLRRLEAQLRENLPDWVCKDPELSVELLPRCFTATRGVPGGAHLYPGRAVAPGDSVAAPRRPRDSDRCVDHR